MRLKTTVSQADWDVVRSNYSTHESGDGAKLIRFVERIAERLEMEKDSSHPDSASKQAWSDLSKIYEENIDLVTEAMFVLVTYWRRGPGSSSLSLPRLSGSTSSSLFSSESLSTRA